MSESQEALLRLVAKLRNAVQAGGYSPEVEDLLTDMEQDVGNFAEMLDQLRSDATINEEQYNKYTQKFSQLLQSSTGTSELTDDEKAFLADIDQIAKLMFADL